MNYVFDVDGTLTPSRGLMDPEFQAWFLSWCQRHPCFLITGSDYAKTVEQVGPAVTRAVRAVYNCAGNAIYVQGQLIYRSDFQISPELRSFLQDLLAADPYPTRTGQHIEDRIGLCNFSIVGRGADHAQRQDYVKYDLDTGNREKLVQAINAGFPEVEATAGGETGVDIYQRGKDKSQVAAVLSPFVFFGDKICPGGNDYTIAKLAHRAYPVENWQDTWRILKQVDQE